MFSWKSTLSSVLAMSSAAAELITLCACAVTRMFQLADVGTAPRGAPQLAEMGAAIHGET